MGAKKWIVEEDERLVRIRVEFGNVPRKWTHVTFWGEDFDSNETL